MLSKLRKQSEGFTIIEVLIVLAIAGLIMVVVFLAVPALQRNARNTSYREDATNMLAAYQEVSGNRAGQTLVAGDNAAVISAANAKTITNLDIAAYSNTAITVNTGNGANQVSVNKAIIRTGSKCSAPDTGAVVAGSARQLAIYYVVETAGGTQIQCQDS